MDPTRRLFTIALATAWIGPALAHHGWSSFDETRPLYLEGTVKAVRWQNPHVVLVLELTSTTPPASLATLAVPRQIASVDAARILTAAKPPTRKDQQWEIELAPLTRMEAWKVREIKPGEKLAVVGYTFKDEKGTATLRAEFLIRDGTVTPMRSAPA
ncbi:MAG: DUF6152 family protein [Casimicrobiaceae bacterium]|nr:DUF6152 family protein [Casimicrobiaceae bacterium]MCX8098935.1 DUF6152 family protein [Casimicrobiaceae bacterium]MDW8312634.1 DUF6152 family protein [Burkholderiales bacterium]